MAILLLALKLTTPPASASAAVLAVAMVSVPPVWVIGVFHGALSVVRPPLRVSADVPVWVRVSEPAAMVIGPLLGPLMLRMPPLMKKGSAIARPVSVETVPPLMKVGAEGLPRAVVELMLTEMAEPITVGPV